MSNAVLGDEDEEEAMEIIEHIEEDVSNEHNEETKSNTGGGDENVLDIVNDEKRGLRSENIFSFN